MNPDKKIKLFVIPASIMLIQALIHYFQLNIQYASGFKVKDSIVLQVFTVLLFVLSYLYMTWEFLLDKRFKVALFLAIPFTVLILIQTFVSDIFFKKGLLSQTPTIWFYINNAVSGLWFTVAYIAIKEGKKSIPYALLLSFLLFAFSALTRSSIVLSPYIMGDDNIFMLIPVLIGAFAMGYTYYYVLNFYSTWQKVKESFSSGFKRQQISNSSFFIPFLSIYTIFFLASFSFFTPYSSQLLRISLSNVVYLAVLLLAFTITLFLLLHTLSNLVFQKLYSIKTPAGITYLLAFIPIINIFSLRYIYIKNKAFAKGLPIYNSTKSEKIEHGNYKITVVIFHSIAMLISLIVLALKNSSTTIIIVSAVLYVVTFAFLMGLYYKKKAWIGLAAIITFSFILKLILGFTPILALSGFYIGLSMVYLYTQSFHSVSLDITSPTTPIEEETNPTEIA